MVSYLRKVSCIQINEKKLKRNYKNVHELMDFDIRYLFEIQNYQRLTNILLTVIFYHKMIFAIETTSRFFARIIHLHKISLSSNFRGDRDKEEWSYITSLFIFQYQKGDLPVPVFSLVKLSLNIKFLLHIMLSLGKFRTETDLIMQPSIKESLYYVNLIGPQRDLNSFKKIF